MKMAWNWGIDQEELTSDETKNKIKIWAKESELNMREPHTKIHLIRKHRELFGSDLRTAKESIEKMFY
jgi:hypothetical protein